MEQSNDMLTVHRSQGAVATLKRLKLLREEVQWKSLKQTENLLDKKRKKPIQENFL